MIATIRDTETGREEILSRSSWNSCPRVIGYRTVCGYWESRCELFLFACNVAGLDPEVSEWIDGETGEILDFYELNEEELDLFDEWNK